MAIVERFHPTPGVPASEFEIPGPGLYEADFGVPGWLFPDFLNTHEFHFRVAGRRVTHYTTRVVGATLTTRFRIENDAGTAPQSPETEWVVGALTVGAVLRVVAGTIFGALAASILNSLVEALRELRKIGESAPAAGLGLGALAVAGAYLIFRRA